MKVAVYGHKRSFETRISDFIIMTSNTFDASAKGILDLVKPDVCFPDNLFLKIFKSYLFFDNDIGSSDFTSTLKNFLEVNFELTYPVNIFATSNLRYLGRLELDDNWVEKISSLRKVLDKAGDMLCGLILSDSRKALLL